MFRRLLLLAALLLAPSSCGPDEALAGSPQRPRVTRGSTGHAGIGGAGGRVQPAAATAWAGVDLDFTALAIPSGATVSRTGAAMYGAVSEGVLAQTAVNVPLIEDRGNGNAGLWVFDAYQNRLTSPLDVGGTGWSAVAPLTVTNVTGPDGVSGSARRLADTGSGLAEPYQNQTSGAGDGSSVVSVWYRHTQGAPSKASYLGNNHTGPEPTRFWKLPTSTSTWRFASTLETHGNSYWGLLVSGYDAWGFEGGADASATGSVDVFAAQYADGLHALPFVNGSTGAQALSLGAGELAKVIDPDGNLDVQVDLVSWWAALIEPGFNPADGYVFKIGGPDGEHSLRYIHASGAFQLKLNGSDVSGASFALKHWRHGGALDFRVTYDHATGNWRIRGRIGGVVNNTRAPAEARPSEIFGTLGAGSALQTPTSFHVGHDGAGGGFIPVMVRRVKTYRGASMDRQVVQIMVVGDSLAANHPDSGSYSLASGILTTTEIDAGWAIVDVAAPGAPADPAQGNNIKVQYLNSEYYGDPNIVVIFVQIGTNDILGLLHTGATVISDTQGLLDAIVAGNPGAQIVLVCPPRFGSNAHYTTLYNAIGAASFTGPVLQTTASADATSLDGVTMVPIYLWDPAVHWINAGRDVAAGVWRGHLQTLSVLP